MSKLLLILFEYILKQPTNKENKDANGLPKVVLIGPKFKRVLMILLIVYSILTTYKLFTLSARVLELEANKITAVSAPIKINGTPTVRQ